MRSIVPSGDGVEVARVEIEVIAEGSGPLVVLVPSFGRDSEDFDAVAAGLARAGLRALRPQPRGTGRSAVPAAAPPTDPMIDPPIEPMIDPPTDPMIGLSYADWAGDILAVVAADGGGPAVLLGHAAGSRYVRAAAALDPGLVRGVVLAGAARPGPPDPALTRDLDACVDPGTSPADRRAALRRAFFAPGNDVNQWLTGWHPATARAQRASRPSDGWAGAGGVPVLDLIGRHDPWRPVGSHGDIAAALGDRVAVTLVDGASHALLPERPAAVVAAVTGWVARL
jgi:pimeloyl-ACP methyl ester carboxylesterase